uniref:IREH1/IRE-like N-terminal domain-containing protein n=1 Tax=Oryza glaberrima TaxID=4538 RepID=I1PSA0_ORYGL
MASTNESYFDCREYRRKAVFFLRCYALSTSCKLFRWKTKVAEQRRASATEWRAWSASGRGQVRLRSGAEGQRRRFRAILRATSRRRKRAPDVKSFWHELNMHGLLLHRLQQQKPRVCVNSPEEFIGAIRTKFIRLKEEVDAELGVFARDLVGALDKADGGEERVALEDLLVVAQRCAEMSPEEPRRRMHAPPSAARPPTAPLRLRPAARRCRSPFALIAD